MDNPSELNIHIYELNEYAFESVINAIYFKAWKDFENFGQVRVALHKAELSFAINRFLSTQLHRRLRRHTWENNELTLMTIYRMALEDLQYRSGVSQGYVTVPIVTQRESVELLSKSIKKLVQPWSISTITQKN
jgi:hypothetical protein